MADFTSLAAVTTTGAGSVLDFRATVGLIAITTTVTGAPTTVLLYLEGSLDNTNWFHLGTSTSTTGETVTISGSDAQYVRANLKTLTGGTSPTVTATIARGLVQGQDRLTNDAYPMTAAVTSVNSSTAVTLTDPAVTPIQIVTLNGVTPAITMPTARAGQRLTLVLTQDGTGSRIPTYVGTVKWIGGSAPTLTTTAAHTDILQFVSTVAGTWQHLTTSLNVS